MRLVAPLVSLYAQLEAVPARERLRRAEAWRGRYGDDPVLLRALGRLCAAQGLWGKAEEFLLLAAGMAPDRETHLLLAQLYERLGRADEAQQHYRAAALAGPEATALPPAATVVPDAT
jgi:HemY protein